MNCQSAYELALSLLGEDVTGEFCADYEKRAPFLLGAFVGLYAKTDAIYRERTGLEKQPEYSADKAPLDSVFPLCDAFLPAAGYYLAAMLIFDSDKDRSDMLYEKCAKIAESLTFPTMCESERIKNVYP